MTNEEKLWQTLYKLLNNAFAVAGFMGNLFAESRLNPKNMQDSYEKKLNLTDETYTAAVDTGSYTNFVNDAVGYGLAQWTYHTRKQNLLSYVKARGVSIGDFDMQLAFLCKELSESYSGLLASLKKVTSVREASDLVLTKFEQPKDQSNAVKEERSGYGQGYYNKYFGNKTTTAQNGGNNMSVRIGHASISENGTINGVAGDSTRKEVCIRTFYSKPWDFVAIHPDTAIREKHANAIEAACENDNIGYGQNDRNTLNILAKAVGYDLSKAGKCNCDCSSLQNVASGSGATYGSNGWTTSTMKSALQKLGYKIITDSTYLTSEAYCVRGAIYVKAGSHTVCGLDNGSKAADTLKKAGITTGTATGSTATQTAVSTLITKLQPAQSKDNTLAGKYKTTTALNLRYGPGKDKYASIVIIPQGATVQCYGYYPAVNGVKWLYVAYGNSTGFCSSAYLKK